MNRYKNILIAGCILSTLVMLFSQGVSGQSVNVSTINLIPQPKKLLQSKGRFELSTNTRIIYANAESEMAAELLNEFFLSSYTWKLKVVKGPVSTPRSIFLKVDPGMPGEGYSMSVNDQCITLVGSAAGLSYGVKTLEQLAPLQKSDVVYFPAVSIQDEPRFEHRGLLLDVSRHFHSVTYVKKFLDVMAHFKLNRFHWHLTDDQGWRIEIKKYPRLQTVSAWREPVENVMQTPFIRDGKYGGYYTQEEIKDVVSYAAKRFITVIPEIEMPGHSTAALAAYPHLGCTGGPYEVLRHGMINKEVYCAGNDSTFAFLQDVLAEVIHLFPGKYIHIGGDETPKERWSRCNKCQARIKRAGLKDEHELQSYFIQRIEKYLNAKGRSIIGWDEILEGGLAPNATVMSWRGETGGIAAARQHHDVIMSPSTYLYFDYGQGDVNLEPPGFPLLPLASVYRYEPLSDSLTTDEHHYIKGVQANIWGEIIRDSARVDYMTYPRALALSEIAWSPASSKDYSRFLEKMKVRLAALESKDVKFRIPEPGGLKDEVTTANKVVINLVPMVAGAKIYYTTDGSQPSEKSKLFVKSFALPLKDNVPVQLKALTYLPSGRVSRTYSATYIKKPFRSSISLKQSKPGISFKYTSEKVLLAKDLLINKPDTAGVMPAISLTPFVPKPTLGIVYEGYILVPADGIYTFSVKSDDGGVLYIADELLIDNDGEHASSEHSASIPLRKGYHKIKLQYFDAGGGRVLDVRWSRDNIGFNFLNSLYH